MPAASPRWSNPPPIPPLSRWWLGWGLKGGIGLGSVPAGWLDYEKELQATPAAFDPPRLSGDHPSFQPYTSGSTGRPKGVILTHAGQMWWIRVCHRYWPMQESDRAL